MPTSNFGQHIEMWILGSRRADLFWLFIPGLLFLLASYVIKPGSGQVFAAYFFIDSSLIGSGHIYTTVWRTYFDPVERRRTSLYIWVPLACFLAFFSWRFFDLKWLVFIPSYLGIFHYMRQSYGIQKWYQKKNGRYSRASDFFLYFLAILPLLIFTFREPTNFRMIMLPGDLFLYPDLLIRNILLAVYGLGVAAWVCYEVMALKYREWNRLGFMTVTVVLLGLCFIAGRNQTEILFPLVAYHGVAYLGIMTVTMKRLRPNRFTIVRALVCVLVTALVFGLWERWIQYDPTYDSRWLASIWAGIYVTPSLVHYVYDAFLWTGKHPEARAIFSQTADVSSYSPRQPVQAAGG